MKTKDHKVYWKWAIVISIVVLVALFFAASFLSAEPNVKFASTAVALSTIGAIAVGIERIIEAVWSFMGVIGKDQWPLGTIVNESENLVTDLNNKLDPYYKKVVSAISEADNVAQGVPANLGLAKNELDKIKNDLEYVMAAPLFDPKFTQVATTTLKGLTSLQKAYPDLLQTANITNQAVQGVVDFVNSYNENPGRRLISIYLGMLLGLGITWLMGLDVFQAVLNTSIPAANTVSPHWGIALTGILMGLGASPTHEVIQILNEIKNNKYAENLNSAS